MNRGLLLRLTGLLLCGAAALALLPSCGRKIGDACTTSIDCNSDRNDRICDISQPSGYCTLDGCDEKTCPNESACIRFFPAEFATRPCDPALLADCPAEQICLDEGLCVPRSTERRFCKKTCDDNSDCRSAYECRLAGTKGSMALTAVVQTPAQRSQKPIHFCAPVGQ